MMPSRLLDLSRLLAVLWILLSAGFFAVSMSSYQVSRDAIREAIIARELPLTSSNIYSEIQKDLVRPILIASTMAHDTFLRDWVLGGEKNTDSVIRYLQEVKARHGTFVSFFVSERTGRYYSGDGALRPVQRGDAADDWYFRVRELREPYEINVDVDTRNRDALTIFVNYRVLDYEGRHIGATGVGLSVDSVRKLLADYQERYRRTIYFVDAAGKIVLFGDRAGQPQTDLRSVEGLRDLVDRILKEKSGSYQYDSAGSHRLLNVSFVPELKWYLFVENAEEEALQSIRRTLYTNLAIALLSTLVVLGLIHYAVRRYQDRIEHMATTDKLTGLINRQAFDIFIGRLGAEARRKSEPVMLLLADIDHFKSVNDRYGHVAGDRVLQRTATLLQQRMRGTDIVARWGGEEFLLALKECQPEEARRIAEELRADVEGVKVDLDDGQVISVTLSIGIGTYDGFEPVDVAIARADAGLYEAKRNGRNRVCVGPPAGAVVFGPG